VKSLLRVFLFLIFAACASASQALLVVYVNNGDPVKDAACKSDLQTMIARLNSGGSSAGYTYSLYITDTFGGAKDIQVNYRDVGATGIAATVYHGVYSNGVYTHNVQDTKRDADGEKESTPDSEVDPYVDYPEHCNAEGKVSTNDIGTRIKTRNHHAFPGGGVGGSGTGGDGSSGGTGGSGGSGGTSTSVITVSYTTSYFDSNGTLWVGMLTLTYYVNQPAHWTIT